MHAAIAARIVRAADLAAGETVLEVGPGGGILTQALVAAGARVVAVEADGALVPALEERFASERAAGALTLVHADVRRYLAGPMPELAGRAYAVVANIPYYLTGELLRALLEQPRQPSALTLLVQKEVAERIAPRLRSGQAHAKGSILALSVKAYGTPRYAFTVPRGAFRPAPKVDSAVLTIRDISRERFASRAEEARFFALLHAGFAHKRKYLRSNLAALLAPGALQAAGVGERARAEDLALADWLALSRVEGLALAQSG